MVQQIGNYRVVAEVVQNGETVFVDCAIRESDVNQDVTNFLLSKARGDEQREIDEAVLEGVQNDALGG